MTLCLNPCGPECYESHEKKSIVCHCCIQHISYVMFYNILHSYRIRLSRCPSGVCVSAGCFLQIFAYLQTCCVQTVLSELSFIACKKMQKLKSSFLLVSCIVWWQDSWIFMSLITPDRQSSPVRLPLDLSTSKI